MQSTAMLPPCRCLETGSLYDMNATFRLVQLWFNLASEVDINERMKKAFQSIPSHKFLSLVYQMASRMTSSQTSPLSQSGFQVDSPQPDHALMHMAKNCQTFAFTCGLACFMTIANFLTPYNLRHSKSGSLNCVWCLAYTISAMNRTICLGLGKCLVMLLRSSSLPSHTSKQVSAGFFRVTCKQAGASQEGETHVQEVLANFMVKLGIDHPYHVLYQLLSLQNGNRDNKGQIDNSGTNKGGLQQNVDVDKVQAAASVIKKVAQHPSRSVLRAQQIDAASSPATSLPALHIFPYCRLGHY